MRIPANFSTKKIHFEPLTIENWDKFEEMFRKTRFKIVDRTSINRPMVRYCIKSNTSDK